MVIWNDGVNWGENLWRPGEGSVSGVVCTGDTTRRNEWSEGSDESVDAGRAEMRIENRVGGIRLVERGEEGGGGGEKGPGCRGFEIRNQSVWSRIGSQSIRGGVVSQ